MNFMPTIIRIIIIEIITRPVANEILFFFMAKKKIIRLIIAPKLIKPPNFPCIYILFQLSSTGESDKNKVKNITDEAVANRPEIKPIKTSFLSKIPCI